MSDDRSTKSGGVAVRPLAELKIPLAHRFKVLVVDDEEEIRNILLESLKLSGYRVVDTAHDGQDAIDQAQKAVREGDRYDIVISDWRMPEITGIELLEKFRKNPFYEKTPFVLLTSVDDADQVRIAIEAGVSDYIVKPFSMENMVERLARINRSVP